MAETVVVTGGSAGVGRATARRFAQDGARVGLIARGRAGLEAAAEDVRRAGGVAATAVADVADPDALEEAAARLEEELGEIDIWVNNAMVTVYGRLWDVSPEEFRRITDVTYLGSVWGMQTALRRFRPRNRGTIVQVGSALGYRGIPLQSGYCGGKHGVNGVVDSVRAELVDEGSDVHVTVVQLPGLNTPQFKWGRSKLDKQPQPMPPIFQPEVAAEGIHYAAHADRREVWVGYSTAGTIIGDRVASGVLDRYLGRNAVAGQQTDQDKADNRPDNLFEPADEDRDFGVHGPFDDKAKAASVQLVATRNRGPVFAAAAAVTAGAAAGLRRLSGRDEEPQDQSRVRRAWSRLRGGDR